MKKIIDKLNKLQTESYASGVDMATNHVMNNKWYWRFTHWGCPVCGKEEVIRDKVYSEKERGHFFEIDASCATYDLG